MAHIAAPFTAADSSKTRVGLGNRILAVLVAITEASPRMKEIERLNAKSDEELAKMGLERAQIVRHVMRDVMYL